MKRICLLAMACFLVWGGGEAGATAPYKLVNLGTLGGNSSYAYAINSNGLIAGSALTAGGVSHAAVWEKPGFPADLGTLGGSASEARDINATGCVVGWAMEAGDVKKPFKYFYQGQKIMIKLPTPNDTPGQALGVNDNGAAVGFTYFAPDYQIPKPCLWGAVNVTQLGTNLGLWSGQANCVTQDSTGAGWGSSQQTNNNNLALIFGDVFMALDPGGTKSEILNSGVKSGGGLYWVGYHTTVNGQEACYWKFVSLYPIPAGTVKPVAAYGINRKGQIVGQAVNANGRGRAFIFDLNTNQTKNLNDLIDPNPDWILNTAYDINDKGQIVGWGYYLGVLPTAFLLEPTSSPAAAASAINSMLLN
jgi:probable HAF family extracellular repeat protein